MRGSPGSIGSTTPSSAASTARAAATAAASCRFDTAGRLIIGTGDAATGTNPQDLSSLAGKTLRVDRFTGAGVRGNASGGDPRIYTYGHRNVQGLALAPNGAVYSVEHGTDRDDEINLLPPAATTGGTRSRATTSRGR